MFIIQIACQTPQTLQHYLNWFIWYNVRPIFVKFPGIKITISSQWASYGVFILIHSTISWLDWTEYIERVSMVIICQGSLPFMIPSKPSRSKAVTSCCKVARCLEIISWWELTLRGLKDWHQICFCSVVYVYVTHRNMEVLNIVY